MQLYIITQTCLYIYMREREKEREIFFFIGDRKVIFENKH
jgi:hypothetical protein